MTANWPGQPGPSGEPPGNGGQRSGRVRAAIAALATLAVVAGIVLVVLHATTHQSAVSLPGGQGGRSAPGTSGHSAGSAGSSPHSRGGSKPGHGNRSGHRSPGGSSGGQPGPAGRLVPARGALFGAWAEPIGGNGYVSYEWAVIKLEREIGRKLAIDQLYDPWSRPLPLIVARWDLRNGRIPMISWAGYHTNLIAAGRFDRMIRARARQLRDLHGPVMLRWFAEMDGRNDRPLVTSPGSFIAAWRRVHRIFTSVGATNVSWVWCPNAGHFPDGVSQLFYPGTKYVDWICADGYNWAPKRAGAPWKNIVSIFSSYYRWGIRMGKPLMIGEFGVLEGAPGAKAAWYRQTDRLLRTMFPRIRAVIYFNSDHQGYDWRITTSRSAMAGFRAFANDPWFSARPRL